MYIYTDVNIYTSKQTISNLWSLRSEEYWENEFFISQSSIIFTKQWR